MTDRIGTQDARERRCFVFGALDAFAAMLWIDRKTDVISLAENLVDLDVFEGVSVEQLIPHVEAWVEAV